MVTTDGSDFFCLSDTPEDAPTRASSSRNRYPGNSVNLRGVTYGDIEGVLSLHAIPPSGIYSRNNKTVPCTICARYGKSSSAVVSAIERKIRNFSYIQREYRGVLMSTRESKKLICLSVDSKKYLNKKTTSENGSKTSKTLINTVKIHPVELQCNSLHCESSPNIYKEGNRIKCLVVTF